ncbi:MAG: VWA domain-containing protein [Candidatus Korobacteraceae bacterium]
MIAAHKLLPAATALSRYLTDRLDAPLLLLIFLSFTLFSTSLHSQTNPPPAATPAATAGQEAPEIASHEETPTFKVKVNLVEVRVVVRDGQGHPIGNLKQDDFQLFDNGKPQNISKFSMEKAGTAPIVHEENAANPGETATAPPVTSAKIVPQRYVAYLFDDIHLSTSDLAQARNAATRQLQLLQPADRAAIYTTSGQTQLDFTDDRAQLIAALNRLMPRPITQSSLTACPNVTYYMADLIQNKRDERALQVAALDALHCAYSDDPTKMAAAQQFAQSTALEELNKDDAETRISLGVLKNLIRRITAMPGERIIILVSPGFLNFDELQEQTESMEHALHANVVINTLDVRGVYTDLPDVSETRPAGANIAGQAQQFRTEEMQADDDILAELAYSTGGTFFHNNNDLGEGFRRLASPPEYSYLLGFSPQNLKLDGHYHKLKVTLKPPVKGAIQARKGYYAPKGMTDPSQEARQAIEDAVFSRDELHDIPVEVHTQFFKSDAEDAKLSVVVHMDVRHIHFRKADGRNDNDVTIVSALFDHNGNFLSGNQKVLQLRLKDATLQGRLGSGITLKSSFDVKPGSYLVRLVVRDEEGQLAAQNSAVEIP